MNNPRNLMDDPQRVRKLTITAAFIALGGLLAPFTLPIGPAKVFPVQHMINIFLAIMLGWQYSVAGAFCISSIRIVFGLGTVLAYPGSMIGALLAGLLYQKTGSKWGAVVGEVFGTGVLGGLLCYPIAAYVLDSNVASALFFVVTFVPNTLIGAFLALLILRLLPVQQVVKHLVEHGGKALPSDK